jgi:hypothetical protein
MYPHRSRLLHAAGLLALVACEDTATSIPRDFVEPLGAELALAVPTDVRDRLVVRTFTVDSVRPDGPARSEHLGYGSYPSDPSYEVYDDLPAAGIWNAETRASFLPGQVSVIGSHEYIGNKSSIDTRGSVSFEGSVIGTSQAYTENSFPFPIPMLSPRYIWAEARIYTDRTCGLSAWGDSSHAAWWEAVLGGPVFTFARIQRTSHADRAYQAACSTPLPPSNTNTGNTYTGGGGEGVCYVWITYDLYSGEIYDQQLLFCTDGG